MQEFLVKYKNVESAIGETIRTVRMTHSPLDTIKVAKEVGTILIDGEYYGVVSTEYKVPSFEEELDVVNIYVVQA